jgi:hypothetical protein
MQDSSVRKLGGTASILLGISYLVIGVTTFLVPPEQRIGDTDSFFRSFAANPTMLTIQYWAWALSALFGLAAVPAISAIVRPLNEGSSQILWFTTHSSRCAVCHFIIANGRAKERRSFFCTGSHLKRTCSTALRHCSRISFA